MATGGRATKEHAFSAAMFEASGCPQHCWGHPLHSEQDTDWTEEGPGEGQSHSGMSPNVAKPVFQSGSFHGSNLECARPN